MKVDQHIVRALNQYLAANHTTQKELSKQLNISESTMVQWQKVGRGINFANWEKLYPLIKRYLPKDRIYVSGTGDEEYSSMADAKKQGFYVPIAVPIMKPLNLLRYNAIVAIEQFARSENLSRTEYNPKIAGIGGIFAYELDKPGLGIPVGARIFASSEAKPRNNSIVLCTTVSGEIVLGVFHTTGDTFELDMGDRKFSGNLVEIWRKFSGIFPVISYEVICY